MMFVKRSILRSLVSARFMAIKALATPNPLCMKFVSDNPSIFLTAPGIKEYRSPAEATRSPLARALFAVEGVTKLMHGADFVTVTKKEMVDWAVRFPSLSPRLRRH